MKDPEKVKCLGAAFHSSVGVSQHGVWKEVFRHGETTLGVEVHLGTVFWFDMTAKGLAIANGWVDEGCDWIFLRVASARRLGNCTAQDPQKRKAVEENFSEKPLQLNWKFLLPFGSCEEYQKMTQQAVATLQDDPELKDPTWMVWRAELVF